MLLHDDVVVLRHGPELIEKGLLVGLRGRERLLNRGMLGTEYLVAASELEVGSSSVIPFLLPLGESLGVGGVEVLEGGGVDGPLVLERLSMLGLDTDDVRLVRGGDSRNDGSVLLEDDGDGRVVVVLERLELGIAIAARELKRSKVSGSSPKPKIKNGSNALEKLR